MKFLMLTFTCLKDQNNGRNDAVRETWRKEWKHLVTHKFLYTNERKQPLGDELVMDVPEQGYMGTPFMSRAAYRWALERNYDYVFTAAPDTYPVVPRLLACGYEKYDWMGHLCSQGHMSGAPGMILSRRALEAVVTEAASPEYEDLWISRVLAFKSITPHSDLRFWADDQHGPHFPYENPGIWSSGVVSVHLGRGTNTFDPAWMRECHRSYLSFAAAMDHQP